MSFSIISLIDYIMMRGTRAFFLTFVSHLEKEIDSPLNLSEKSVTRLNYHSDIYQTLTTQK